jgi:hypothetical protein
VQRRKGAAGEDIGVDARRLDELLGPRKVRRAAVALPPDVAAWVGRLTEAVSREEGRQSFVKKITMLSRRSWTE